VLCDLLPDTETLDTISSEVLDAAIVRLTASRPKKSEVTLNRHRSTFKTFFRWAFETGRVSRNPAVLLRLARVDSPPTPPITIPETCLLLATIRHSRDPLRLRDQALFAMYALTGVRRAEALQLNISDYDRSNGLLRLNNGKGRQARVIPVVRPLALLLEELRGDPACRQNRERVKLFPGRIRGRSLTTRQANARFDRWKAVAGLRAELTIHSFRAGFATTLHREAGDVLLVSRALGHRDLRQTLRYVAPYAEMLPKAMERSFAGVVSA